jgi:hypothetical protein
MVNHWKLNLEKKWHTKKKTQKKTNNENELENGKSARERVVDITKCQFEIQADQL